MKEWTFVTNHGLVLSYVADHKRITSREIATALGITERRVQRIIADLEQSGYITKTRSGRHNTYVVDTELTLRHPAQRDRAVKELLAMLKPLSHTVQKKKPTTVEMPRLFPDTIIGQIIEKPKSDLNPAISISSAEDENTYVAELGTTL
jgi:predicted ArsR family transcriptional regulator